MDQKLENDLREAFSLHASGITTDAGARLRRIDYHPRTSRISPRLTVGSLAGAAATGGVVASVVMLGGAPAAFAGWSASPTPASTGQAATADAACQARLASAPALPGATGGSGWRAVATDVRGSFTVVIYQDGDTDATCFTSPSFTVLSRSSGSGSSTSASGSESGSVGGASSGSVMVGSSESGGIEHLSVAHMASTNDGPYTLVEGQVKADVTAVTLLRSDGNDIQTSTGSGWFVAWWPGSQGVTSADITTAGGVSTQTLNTAPLPPPPGGGACDLNSQTTSSTACTGGASGGATGGFSTSG